MGIEGSELAGRFLASQADVLEAYHVPLARPPWPEGFAATVPPTCPSLAIRQSKVIWQATK